MTIINQNTNPSKRAFPFNRFLYVGLVSLGIYFLLSKDISSALVDLGIALAFDPFDQNIAWSNRLNYQKILLFVHVSIVFGLLGMLLVNLLW